MTIDLVVAWSLRLGLALLFVMAAWHKLSDRPRFEAAVSTYELLPKRASFLLSWVLPLLETAIAAGLLYPATQGAAAVAASAV
ncbi:MAG: MauE/DoxX family redox-associated membrane protein, partial [Polyangiales bacterium]